MMTHEKLLLGPVGTLWRKRQEKLVPRSRGTEKKDAKTSFESSSHRSRFISLRTVDVFLRSGKVNRLHAADLLSRADHGRASLTGQAPTRGSDGSLLDGGRGQLASQLRAKSPGKGSGSHCVWCGGWGGGREGMGNRIGIEE